MRRIKDFITTFSRLFHMEHEEKNETGLENGIDTEKIMSALSGSYLLLYDGVDIINSTVTFQLIPFIAFYMTSSVSSFYSIIHEFINNSELFHCYTISNMSWLLLEFHLFILPLYGGSAMTKEV